MRHFPLPLALALALAGCATVSPTDNPAPTAPSPSATATATASPQPSPSATQFAVPADQFPKLDGSTANLPLGSLLLQLGGVPKAQADNLAFSKTQAAYLELASSYYFWRDNQEPDPDDPDAEPVEWPSTLLLVYEPDEETRESISDVPLEFHPIGRDALVFIANESNPVESLTPDQLLGIYTGKIKNWKKLGGPDVAITAYQRPEDSGSGALMRKFVMGAKKLAEAPTELVTESMGGLVDGVANYANEGSAIGYSVFYYVSQMYDMPGLKLLQVGGVAPSNETIAAGEYPYVNDFYAVILAGEPEDSPARQLVEYLESADGKALIAEAGYVPLP
ncbi:MAG: substrate-binding domain-containing protein [Propionibacteriaceae bacterium]|jgi:phosphate transport system substrate-binding protein|nr:substrate-binding domain-containing protein [Propionibacteriaceae bacterium]